jgi:hypothetical protein
MHVRRLARWQIVALMAALPGCSVLFPIDVDEYAKDPTQSSDGATSDSAGGCFELIAARPLPDPIDPTAYLSGPGIVATKDGFLIAYREQMSGATKSRLTSVVLDDQGMLSPSKHIAFDSGCASPIPDDGVGVAWSETRGDGLAAVSQLDCGMTADGGAGGHTAGLTLIGFDGQGSLPSFNTVRGAGNSVSLARVHSVAPLFADGAFAVLSTIDQIPTLALIASKGAGTIDPDIGSIQPMPVRSSGFAEIAASKDLLSRLIEGTNEAGVGASLLLDGGIATLSSDEAGTGGTVDDDLPDGPAGAVAVSGEQALTAMVTATGIEWRMRTLASAEAQGALDVEGPVLGVDAAWLGTGAIVAAGRKGGLELFRLPDAASSIQDAGSTDTSRTMDLSNLLSAFDGGHFAIAGARGVIALTWLTSHALQGGEPTGGYAVFRCP